MISPPIKLMAQNRTGLCVAGVRARCCSTPSDRTVARQGTCPRRRLETTRSTGTQNQGGLCSRKSGPMLQRSDTQSTNHLYPSGTEDRSGGLSRLALAAVWKSPQSADSPPTRCVAHASRAQRNPRRSADLSPLLKNQVGR